MTTGTGPPSAGVAAVAAKAAHLRRLELLVTRRLDGLLSGEFLGLLSGPGSEPAGARPYGAGDDARRIDWSLTARSLAPHVRTTDADRELETWIVADRSASLDFGTALSEKRELVLCASAAFGFLTVGGGNRLGVLVAGGDRVTRLGPASTRTAMLSIVSRLYDTPRRESVPAPDADLTGALQALERIQHRRGQVIVVSDFLDASDWLAPLRRLAMRHQVIAVQIVDPRELELPPVGMLSVVDIETGRRMHVQTNSARLRARYATAAGERHGRIGAVARSAGALHLVLSTDSDWLLQIVRFVVGGRRRRGALGRTSGARPSWRPAPTGARATVAAGSSPVSVPRGDG